MKSFQKELEELINYHSKEMASDTPDFILAAYLHRCLETWNITIVERNAWYGCLPKYSDIAPSADK